MPVTTLAEVREQVYDRLENNTRFYRQTRVDDVINDTVRVLNLLTGYLQTRVFIPSFTIANRRIYDVPAGILIPLRLDLEGKELRKTSLANLSQAHSEWMKETSDSTGLPTSEWAPIGLTKFALWPAPSQAGMSLRVTGVQEPDDLTDDDDVIAFPDEYSEAFENLSSHILPLKEGGLIFSQAALFYTSFLSSAKELSQFQRMKMPQYFVERESPK